MGTVLYIPKTCPKRIVLPIDKYHLLLLFHVK